MERKERDWMLLAATVLGALWLAAFPLWQDLSYAHITRAKWLGALVLCGVSVLSGVVMAAAAVCRRKLHALRWHPVQGIALAYFAWVALSAWQGKWASSINGQGQLTVWMGAIRYEGLLTQLCYALIFLMLSFFPVRLNAVLSAAAVAVAIYAGIVALQYTGLNVMGLFPSGRSIYTNYEFQGTIGNIDMVSGYLSLLVPLLLGAFATREKGGWLLLTGGLLGVLMEWCMEVQSGLIALMLLCALLVALALRYPAYRFRVCLVLAGVAAMLMLRGLLFLPWMDQLERRTMTPVRFTFGIKAVVGFVLMAAFGLLAHLTKKKPGKAVPWRIIVTVAVAIVVTALACIAVLPISKNRNANGLYELHELLNGRPRLSFGTWRLGAWKHALRMSSDNLLFGNGPDTFYYAFYDYLQTAGVTLGETYDNPHNEYLAILANNGLPAVVFYFALLGGSVIACWRRKLWPLALAIVCYAVQGHFSFSICLVTPMFWAVMGMAAALCGKPLQHAAKHDIIPDEVNGYGNQL